MRRRIFERYISCFDRLGRGEGADEHGCRTDEEDSTGKASGGTQQERLEGVFPAAAEAAEAFTRGVTALL